MQKVTNIVYYTTPSSQSFVLSQRIKSEKKSFCILLKDTHSLKQSYEEICFFEPTLKNRLIILNDYETLPYDKLSPNKEIISSRIDSLWRLLNCSNPILLVTLKAWMQYLPPKQFIANNCFSLKISQDLNLDQFRKMMINKNYLATKEVNEIGQYSIRGAIIDIWPNGSKNAFRIELFDNEVDTIRILDIDSHLSLDHIDKISIFPLNEFILNKETTKNLKKRYTQNVDPNYFEDTNIKKILAYQNFPGIEYYLPLFFDKLNKVSDYLPSNTTYFLDHNWKEEYTRYYTYAETQYHNKKKQADSLCKTVNIFETIHHKINEIRNSNIYLTQQVANHKEISSLAVDKIAINYKEHKTPSGIEKLIQDNYTIIITAINLNRLNNLISSLNIYKIKATKIESLQNIINMNNQSIYALVAPLENGFVITSTKNAFITENDLIGRININYKNKVKKEYPQRNILNLTDHWEPGTLLVHRDYGIGKFLSFQTLKHNNTQADYIQLEYKNNDILYVSIWQLHLLTKYIGVKPDNIVIDNLGSKKWQNKKQKAKIAIEDLAAKILESHAKAKIVKAAKCIPANDDYALFCESFPFETTQDQQLAIDAVLEDIQKPVAMDKLICGDVGFGKTEVALRAAFMTIQSGYQVAVITPTTVLANQHYTTFKERFDYWPFRVELLSRTITGSKSDLILNDLENSKVDLVISTHKLLHAKIKIKKLGLIIIDEEHKFGVKQKEILQKMRGNAHILSLSATPIPRTLHMAMSNLRSMNIIATPPENRKIVNTFVHTYNENIIQEAILREKQRGGQIYYMHNDISQLPKIQEKLQKLVPGIKCEILHGKTQKKQLQEIMVSFANNKFQILIATSIIESGIDIPNANTIIIHRADLLGLSQIHQLRGRVGRSNKQAYAYLFTVPENCLTKTGIARIATIKKQDKLGSGLNIALEDLEIRGAGDLLGNKQSGHLEEIGLSLYTQLLDKASKKLQGKKCTIYDQRSEIETIFPSYIPSTYIQDIVTRLEFYRKINIYEDKIQLAQVKKELENRFGLIPIELDNLLIEKEIQQQMQTNNIQKLTISKKETKIIFYKPENIKTDRIIELSEKKDYKIRFIPPNKISIERDLQEKEAETYKKISNFLSIL